jgi:IS5 family transposase
LQQWYALSDPAVEEALYDSAAMRRFVGIDRGLAKNGAQVLTLFALANLWMARKHLLATTG